jgi:LSD1 subclass zinc finger protein
MQDDKGADYPINDSPVLEPMHCSHCGTLLGYFAPGSLAEMRCANCKNDYNVSLREEGPTLRRKRPCKMNMTRGK